MKEYLIRIRLRGVEGYLWSGGDVPHSESDPRMAYRGHSLERAQRKALALETWPKLEVIGIEEVDAIVS